MSVALRTSRPTEETSCSETQSQRSSCNRITIIRWYKETEVDSFSSDTLSQQHSNEPPSGFWKWFRTNAEGPSRAWESMPRCAAFWVFLRLIHNSCWQLLCVYIRSRWYRRYFWLRVTAEFRLKIYSEQTKADVRKWHMTEERRRVTRRWGSQDTAGP